MPVNATHAKWLDRKDATMSDTSTDQMCELNDVFPDIPRRRLLLSSALWRLSQNGKPKCFRPSQVRQQRRSSFRREQAKCLHLNSMVAANQVPLGTVFTVSVECRHRLITGILADERTNTVRALANGQRYVRINAPTCSSPVHMDTAATYFVSSSMMRWA